MNTNDSFNQTKTVTARIVSVHKNRFQIALDSAERKAAEHDAVLAGRLLYRGEIPVVGDYIEAEFETSPVGKPVGDARIVSILLRKSLITRPEYRVGTQNMAANVDICFLVVSANADFSVNRIARYASAVLQGGSKPVIVLTKADLCSDLSEYMHRITEICGNIQMHCVSSKTGVGIDELRQYLVPGTTIGLFGSSGVGKSTLINTLLGREIMRTGDIREKDDKGRHTTTHRQLIEADGVFLVDTPSAASDDAKYHVGQSQMAIGSGRLTGKGFFGEQTLAQLRYVPARHTDFIFSGITEAVGFIGSAILIIVFFALLFRWMYIAIKARDNFGTCLVTGVSAMLAAHIFENIGMTMGIMPVTGIPLPFISYGGSNMLTNMIGVGIVLNVYMRRPMKRKRKHDKIRENGKTVVV